MNNSIMEQNMRNFKDFLLVYNKLTESCFAKCVDNLNERTLAKNEEACVEDCSSKFVKYNHRLMSNFVKSQSAIMNKRMLEAEAEEKKQMDLQNQNLQNQEVAAATS